MLVKLGIAAAVLTYATVSLASVDYRELYNEMYPANGLKRGVLGLCQAAKPTFVRAIEQDRVDCYDSMPSAIERAIGWIRTSARLAAMRAPTGVELAEKLMQQAELRQPFGLLRFASNTVPAGSGSSACESAATQVAAAAPKTLSPVQSNARLANAPLENERLAQRIASGDEKLLAEIGVAKPGARADAKRSQELPVLPLDGSGVPGQDKGAPASNAAAAPSPGLGGNGPAPFASAGCHTPA
jgi:hypothetical protein